LFDFSFIFLQKKELKSSYRNYFILLLLLTLILALVDISIGSADISMKDVLFSFSSSSTNSNYDLIIWNYRIPKMLTVMLTGFALPVSGLIMQSIFRNPLSGPFVLGVSSGAGLGVALSIMLGSALGISLSEHGYGLSTAVSGSIGAGIVMLLIMTISERLKSLSALLIVGIMIASFSSSITGILQFFTSNNDLRSFVVWTMGNVGGSSWSEIVIMSVIVVLSNVVLFSLSKGLNAVALGERYAHTLGVNVKTIRRISLLVSSLLAGTITAIVGPIAFVGMAVPHLAKFSIDSVNHRYLIPYSMLLGAVMMLFFDIISQILIPGQNIPINIITSLLGAPFVVFVIFRRDIKISV
jgi:iron complex transport system permease protein